MCLLLRPRIHLSILAVLVVLTSVFTVFWRGSSTRSVRASDTSAIYLGPPQVVETEFAADPLSQRMQSGAARPVSMAAADLDGDGIADLAAGYASDAGGVVAVFTGNLDAVAPQSTESLSAIARGQFPSPLLRNAQLVAIPFRPDFLAAGRFSGASGLDILAAASSGAVTLLSRDESGSWQPTQSTTVGGSITGVAVRKMAGGQYSQVLIGARDERGPKLLLYSASETGLTAITSVPLPGDATAFEFGDLDGDGVEDAAILAGGSLLLAPASILDAPDPGVALQTIPLPFTATRIALGMFVFDRSPRLQIAVGSADGAVHIMAHERFDGRGLSAADLAVRRAARFRQADANSRPTRAAAARESWKELESYTGLLRDGAAQMFRTRISGYSADDLMILEPAAGRLSIIAHANQKADGSLPEGVVLSRPESLSGLVSALAVRVNVDARPGVALFRSDSVSPLVMMPLPDPVFTVNTTADGVFPGACAAATANQCTLREAIREANAAAGADTIILPAGTYTLTLAGANENAAATGDLDITDTLTITGAGAASTIIQAGASTAAGIDKVLSINPLIGSSFDVSISGVTIQNGRNPSAFTGDGMGGGLDFDSGTGGTGNLTLTNCTIRQNMTTDGDGGGLAVFNAAGGGSGLITITGSTISGNVAQESSTGNSGIGGGLFVGFGAHVALTNTQISSNQAVQTLGSKGQGGGIFLFGPTPTTQSVIHGGSITGNAAGGDGGGIWTSAGITIDSSAVISSNSAVNGGGLLYSAPGETATISKTSFLSNTATTKGGAIEVASQAGSVVHISFSRFAGNSAPTGSNLDNSGSTVNATFTGPSWWGTNTPAPTIAGTVTFDPFIVLRHTASPASIPTNGTSTLTASFLQDNHGTAVSAANLDTLIGAAIAFNNPVLGSLSGAQTAIQANGQATATFTAGNSPGTGHADAVVDGFTLTANVNILAPPSITKTFAASPIAVNATTTVTFAVNNPNAVTIDASFTDSLPAGLVVANTPGVTNTCGGTVTAVAGSSSISFSNASLAVGNCSIGVSVLGTTDGVKNNSVTINSTAGGAGNTSNASLTVANPPSITKSFGAASVALNGTTTLTFTLSSSNSNITITGVAFTDNLPAGLVVATPGNLSSNCSGTATAADGATSVALSGASLGPGASCTISLTVLGATAGVKNNSVSASSTNAGTGNTSNASLAVIGPPVIIKAFGAASIPLNGSTSLSFTIQNNNATASLSGVAFSDTLPGGLAIATPNGLTGSCGGGTITAAAASSVVSLSGATLAASTSCTFSVNVTGVAAGQQNNTTGSVTSTEGGTGGTASASVKVEAPPSIAKAFNPTTIGVSATTSLTFTITNPAANVDPLTGVAFSDTLPTGLTVANATATACGGTVTTTAPTGIALTGATVAVNSQCQINVTVTGATSGSYTNTTGAVTSTNGGTGNTATANLTVLSPPSVTKAFGAASIPLNGSTSLTFTIQNPNAGASLTGVAFTDNLPAGLVVASTPNVSNTCGGTVTATGGSGSVALSGATVAASGSCTVAVDVQGTTAGVKNNSVQITSTNGGTGNTSNASLTVAAPPVIIKAFGAPSIPLNGSTSLTFTIQNNNASLTMTGVAFSDTLPAGLVVASPNGLTGSCGAGTITATAATNVVSLAGGSVAASSSCTFSINVTGVAAGLQNNTTGNVASSEGGTGGTASASVKVEAPPSIAKAFNPATIALNATTSLTFTITNPSGNVDALTGVAFSDTLPTGLTVPNASATICGGTVTLTAPTGIALSGASIAVNGQCQFSVTVTGAASGAYTNTTGSVTSTNGGTGNTATSNLTVASPPTISKAFGAAAIGLNGGTTLSFAIQNPNTNVTLNGVAFSDSLPAGLLVAATPNLTSNCGGTTTAVPASGSVTLSGGSLPANSSCLVSVTVQGVTAGIKNNSVQVTSTEGGSGNTSNASITVVGPPVIIKSFGAASIPLNGSTSLSFTIQNNNPTVALTGVGFSDTLPAGLVIATPNGLTGSCGAGTITATEATSVVSLATASLLPASSCTFSINVTGTAAGLQTNTTGNVGSTEGGLGGTASASVKVEAPPSIAKAFNPTTIPLNGTTSLTFTVTNPAANVDALTGVAFTDTLPTGLTVPNASATVCGGTVTLTAPTGIALSGATIAVNSQCQFSVTVTGAASGSYTNTSGAVTSTNGGTGNTATANLAVASPPSITKAFGAAQIPLNGTTSLTFSITNPNTVVAQTGVSFTDSLPAGLLVAASNNLSNTCGGTATASGGSGSISLTGGTLATTASCVVSVTVQGVTGGVKNNSVTVSAVEGGTGNTSNATLTVVSPPVMTKAFGAASIPLNGSTSLTFTIQNPNATAALSGVAFADALPAGLAVATPNGLTGSCGAGTITATAGSSAVTLSGGTIAASGSCTFSVNVTGTAAGLQSNTTGAVSSTEGGTGGTASASIKVEAPPSITKAFNPATIVLNATTSLTFTITNPAANMDALTGVAFTDTLPAGLSVPNASATVCGGTVTLTAPTGISLTGATIAVNSQCTFSITVTGAANGVYTNTTGNVSSTNGGTGNSATANLNVAVPPTITKAFGAPTIPLGGATSLTFSIANPNSGLALTGVSFNDTLPAGLLVATPSGITGACGSGTISAVPGAGSISLSGGSLAAAGSCSFSVNVTGGSAGIKSNTTGPISATESGPGTASNTANLTVVSPPAVSKTFGAATIPLNGSTSLTFTFTNSNATVALTGIALTDSLPAGLAVASPNGATSLCGGTIVAPSGGNAIAISGATVGAAASCTFAVNVTGTAAGLKSNTTGAVSSIQGGTGAVATASIAVVAPPSISKAFTTPLVAPGGNSTLAFTITNPSDNTVAESGVAFTDTLPAGLTVTSGSAVVCGGSLTTTAPGTIALSGATIPVGGQCQFTVAVASGGASNYTNTTGPVSSSNGGTGNSATAVLSVGVFYQILTSPPGFTVSVDGVSMVAPQSVLWAIGSTHTISTGSPQFNAGHQFDFANWSDGGAITHTVTAAATPGSFTANFTRRFESQTINFPPISNKVFGTPPFSAGATSSAGLPVTLTVLSGPATVSGQIITLTGVGHVVIEATQPGDENTSPAAPVARSFEVSPAAVYSLTLAANPPEGGSISANPPGPVFGIPTNVQVQAQANPGWLFIGFSGDLNGLATPQTLSVSQSRSVTANFARISTDPNDQVQFGVFKGGALPPAKIVPLGASGPVLSFAKDATAKGTLAAGPALLVVPGTGGSWLSASSDATSLVLSLDPTVVPTLDSGSYVSYVVVATPAGGQRVITVRLLVDLASISSLVDSAGYRAQALASQELVTVFGVNLSTREIAAQALPLDSTLGGTSVSITDARGAVLAAQLLYVSGGQINLLTPAGMAPGKGTLTVTNAAGQKTSIDVQIDTASPGLFSADQTGKGVAAAVVERFTSTGDSTNSLAASFNGSSWTANPIDVGDPSVQVFLSLYGTGLRGRSSLSGVVVTVGGVAVEALYAGAQSQFPGLDQINLRLPSSLAGRGDVTVNVTVDGHAANPVIIRIR